jgi:hypothetical protein
LRGQPEQGKTTGFADWRNDWRTASVNEPSDPTIYRHYFILPLSQLTDEIDPCHPCDANIRPSGRETPRTGIRPPTFSRRVISRACGKSVARSRW